MHDIKACDCHVARGAALPTTQASTYAKKIHYHINFHTIHSHEYNSLRNQLGFYLK